MPPRTDFPLEDSLAVEIMRQVLREKHHTRNVGPDNYETRRWAAVLIAALKERHVGLLQYPKIVKIEREPYKPPPDIVSSREVRAEARYAWSAAYQKRKDPAEGFAAALRATIAMQPNWTVEDAALHTIKFILPSHLRRGR